MRWVKDQKIEALMRRLGIQFDVEVVKVADIDLAEGIRRQARLVGKLNDDAVLTMACAMSETDASGNPTAAFPMTVLQKPPRGLLWPWSGNHRLASRAIAWPDETTIEAYVTCIKDPLMLDIFPRVVNASESPIGFGKDERVINARWLVEHHSMSAKEAAALFGIKPDMIYRANATAEVQRALAELGVKANGIAKSVLTKMSPLCNNRNVLRATAGLFHKFNVKTDECERIITEVKGQNTELQQTGILSKWEVVLDAREGPKRKREKAQQKGGAVISRAVRDQFLKLATGLARLLEKHDTAAKLQITDPGDALQAHQASKTIIAKLTAVMSGK